MEGKDLDHGAFRMMMIARSAFPRLPLTFPIHLKQGIDLYIQSLPYEGLGVDT